MRTINRGDEPRTTGIRTGRFARTGIAAAAAATLLATAATAAFRDHASVSAKYGDDGGNSGTTTAIAVGGAAAVVGGLAAAGVIGGGAAAGGGVIAAGTAGLLTSSGDAEIASELPEGQDADKLRVVPGRTKLGAGESRTFDLQARSVSDKKWYSVINRSGASLDLRNATPCVSKQDGSKNVFMVPANVSPSCNGQVIPLLGTYSRSNGSTLSADGRITVSLSSTGQ